MKTKILLLTILMTGLTGCGTVEKEIESIEAYVDKKVELGDIVYRVNPFGLTIYEAEIVEITKTNLRIEYICLAKGLHKRCTFHKTKEEAIKELNELKKTELFNLQDKQNKINSQIKELSKGLNIDIKEYDIKPMKSDDIEVRGYNLGNSKDFNIIFNKIVGGSNNIAFFFNRKDTYDTDSYEIVTKDNVSFGISCFMPNCKGHIIKKSNIKDINFVFKNNKNLINANFDIENIKSVTYKTIDNKYYLGITGNNFSISKYFKTEIEAIDFINNL